MRHKEGSMQDKLKTAMTAYAEAQKKVLERAFDNITRTENPSSADLAFYLPDDVIAGLPQEEQYDAFLRKLRFLGYAMWKTSCYRQLPEHAAFEAERMRLIERFLALERRFQEGVREGRPAPAPNVGPDTSPDSIGSNVADNGCTLFLPQGQLEALHGFVVTTASMPADELQRRRSRSSLRHTPRGSRLSATLPSMGLSSGVHEWRRCCAPGTET
jgi:hypothetical protein